MPSSRPSLASLASFLAVIGFACLAPAAFAAPLSSPTPNSILSVVPASATVAPAPEDANGILWTETSDVMPEPQRGSLGTNILGPQNVPLDLQNADLLAPPSTDAGTVGNVKWPFSLSPNRLQTGGWARQQNVNVMPIATEMAGVDMRLEAGAIRELHWHKTAEWAFILNGSVQITVINPNGQNYLATLNPSDIWYFPAGVPHSIQATADNPAGSEFLLVFDSGDFSEDSTFLLTDWLAHVPKEVLAKNFQTDISAFDEIPGKELYIFPSDPPADDAVAVPSPQGTVPASEAFSFEFSKVPRTPLAGGSVRIVDSTTFPISTTIAAAEVIVDPGAMRELHWHPSQDEWSYYIEGAGRMTVFASSGQARTFNYGAGDVGYVPASFGHYIENTGTTPLRFLEIFKSDRFQDISLQQWLALTPPALVKAHLNLDDETIAHFNKTKNTVIGPSKA
ncbi:oxalate decarboxylase family bicupin [Phanerochaete sordida]|uniref:Oxalate decarboxylase family bicupin n=1 Tax=Phanerochaete sordida TaxID=48140 RepID=A0A9P3L818_9APHY|nr:oxalate decarboxylase family bicupin [Phanerochaete sordida]